MNNIKSFYQKHKKLVTPLVSICFCVVIIVIIAVIIINIAAKNPLLGKWCSEDGIRLYTFDENTLRISSTQNDYSIIYGYKLGENSTIIVKNEDTTEKYRFTMGNNLLFLIPINANSDSSEKLIRVLEP